MQAISVIASPLRHFSSSDCGELNPIDVYPKSVSGTTSI